jgi:hypothetical protein
MHSFSRLRDAAFLAASALALTACAGSSTPLSPPAVGQTSRIAPAAHSSDLLYVSDEGTNDVYVLSYPRERLRRTLTGFTDVAGECVDGAGDVFIVDSGASDIVEYAHGGSTPKATLLDPGYEPIDCAVDPTNGDLAVTNISAGSSKPGNVVLYKSAKGKPKAYYVDPELAYPEFCAYDDSGDLYLDGGRTLKKFQFAEMPSGHTTFINIKLNQRITAGAGVAWDGKHVEIEDMTTSTIFHFAIKGKRGMQVGVTPLVGAKEVDLFWIQKSLVLGADFGSSDVGVWSYPSGGPAKKVVTGFDMPVDAVISAGK